MSKIKYILIFFSFSLLNFALVAQPTWNWSNAIHSSQDEKVLDITTNPSNGETYACGYFSGDLSSDFTMGLNGTPNMNSPIGVRDGFVAKYDNLGNVIWAFKVGGLLATVEIEAITEAPNGNIYVTGEFFDAAVEFQGVTSSISSIRIPTGLSKDMFLAAYNPNGELLWVTSSTDTGNSVGFGITADINGIYVAGRFAGDITFPPLSPITWSATSSYFDGYIAKFDYTGSAIRVKTIFNQSSDGHVKAFNVVTDGADVYAIGSSEATSWSFGPTGVNPTDVNNGLAGTGDIWVISIRENNFNLNWAQVIGSVEDDIAKGIAVDVGGLYLTGGLGGASINFPGIAPVASVGTAQDIFISKLFPATGNTDWVFMEQNFSAINTYGSEIVVDPFGDLFVTGAHTGTTDFNGGLNSISSAGGLDVFVMSRKNTGAFNWVISAGGTFNDEGFGIGIDNNGGIYTGGSYDFISAFGAINLPTDAQNNGFVAKLNLCSISIVCPANQTVTANASCQYTLLDYTAMATPVASCGIQSVKQLPIPGTVVNSGVNLVTIYLTDNNGNIDSCSFDVIVQSAVNPTVVSCGTYLVGETTVGSGDTENNFGCVGYGTPGEDIYYQVTVPAGNYWLQMKVENVVDVNDPWLETFWIGGSCPLGGGCISSAFYDVATQQFPSTGSNSLQFLALGPATYYFVVDAQNDGIDSYDISFDCLAGGIEFDTSLTCGDPNNDGIIPYVNGATILTTQTCQSVNICHDMYIANQQDAEWIDSVYMDLGPCYINVVPTTSPGSYQPGNWVGNYNGATNAISWQFNNTSVATFGDGSGSSYSCDLARTRLHQLCFTADISVSCAADSNLNISLLISDDAIGSSGSSVASIDYVLSNGFTITNLPPTITCPSNVSANVVAGTCSAIVNSLTPVINDNCPGSFVTYSLTGATIGSGVNDASGEIFNIGVTTIQYIVSDSLGLKDSCIFTVTVIDNINPTITCPSNVNIVCPTIVNGIAPIALADNCGIDSVSYVLTGATTGSGLNDASGIFFNTGVTTITYTVTDLTGNTTVCNFTVTVFDNINPTITCPGNVSITSCPTVINSLAPTATGDNCGVDSISYLLTGATTGNGLTDASGTFFNAGVTTVTYTITDLTGNTATCNFTITVIDNANPTITCPGNINTNNDAGICTAIVSGISPVPLDNCGIDSVSYILSGVTTGSGLNDASGIVFNLGITTITYLATDFSGNTATCNFTINVIDNEAPNITCPGDVNVNNDLGNCSAVVSGLAPLTIGDNCAIDSVNYTMTGVTIGSGLNDVSGTVFNTGITTVTYTITDDAGNINSCNFNVVITDNEAPTFSCLANINVSVNASCNFTIPDYTGTILGLTDNCTPNGSIVVTQFPTNGTVVSGSLSPQNITIYARDVSGNIDSCSFSVNLIDTIKPTISCPGNVNVNNDNGSCGSIVNNISPVAFNDNCAIDSVSYTMFGATTASGLNDASGVLFNQGTTNVTYMITDVSGNTQICDFSVMVADNEAPNITCPGSVNVNNDLGNCSAVVSGLAPLTIGDNCAIDSVSYTMTGATIGRGLNDASGTTFNLGLTTITYLVTDSVGNTTSCNFTVTVSDNEAPVFSCPSNITEYVDGTCSFAIPNYTGTISGLSDNCSPNTAITITQNPTAGNVISGHGTIQIITIYAMDVSNNIDSCTLTITLQDTIKPTIVCPGDTVVVLDNNCSVAVPNFSATAVNDNCATTPSITVTQLPLAGIVILNDTLIILTANDGNGNSDTCSFMLFVTDTISPVVVCPNDTVTNNDAGLCSANLTFGVPVNSDNCVISTVNNDFNNSNNASGIYQGGVTTVDWTVTDNYGNTGTCSFNVTIVDAEKPTINCLNDTIINADNNSCDAVFNYTVTAFDNCFYTITQLAGLPSGSTFPTGVTTNTFFATDSLGLADTCSFDVTVIDNQNPTIICPSNIVGCDSSLIIPMPSVGDNCVISTVNNDFNNSNNASDTYPVGITNLTWVVTDSRGNSNTCVMTVQVDGDPTVANAGADQNILLNQSTNFEGNTPAVGVGTWSLISGGGTIDFINDPLSLVSALNKGDNIFRWTIINGTCLASTDEVNIIVGGLKVPSGFSPNGDGVNDLFVIPGAEKMNNEVVIFNRWGVEVFSKNNYQNDWDGISNTGKTLPEDTYFYTIKLTDFGEDYSGYVVIKR